MAALLVLGLAAACGWVSYNGIESKAETADETTDAAETAEAKWQATQTMPKGLEIPRYTSNRGGQLIAHLGYTVSYDADYKTPQWVAWELTADEAQGEVPRYNKFQPNELLTMSHPKLSAYSRAAHQLSSSTNCSVSSSSLCNK